VGSMKRPTTGAHDMAGAGRGCFWALLLLVEQELVLLLLEVLRVFLLLLLFALLAFLE
jgi:hypothetical protein